MVRVGFPLRRDDFAVGLGRTQKNGRSVGLIPTGTLGAAYTDVTLANSAAVTVVDQIIVQGMSEAGGVGPHYDTLNIRLTNGTTNIDMPLLWPGTTATTMDHSYRWKTKGGFVIPAGYRMQASVSDALTSLASIGVIANMVPVDQAVLGELDANNRIVRGLRPTNVNRTQLIPPVAGKAFVIEGYWVRGFGADAASQNLLLEFGIAAPPTYHNAFRWYSQQGNMTWALNQSCSDVYVCGPVGYGVYATASKANAFSIIVFGRYIDEADAVDPTGAHTAYPAVSARNSDRFWCHYDFAAPDFQSAALFPTTEGLMTVVEGIQLSATAAGAPTFVGFGAGDATLPGITFRAIGSYMQAAAACDTNLLVDEIALPLYSPDTIRFACNPLAIPDGVAAGTVWGRIIGPDTQLLVNVYQGA